MVTSIAVRRSYKGIGRNVFKHMLLRYAWTIPWAASVLEISSPWIESL